MKKRITKRILSLLLACMVGIGAFFGATEKAHAIPAALPPIIVIGVLSACGITLSSSDAVNNFMSKYENTALFQAIFEEVKQCKIEVTAGKVLIYSVTKGLIDAVKNFWKSENVAIQAEFGGSIEGGVWKGTAEMEIEHVRKANGGFDSSVSIHHVYNLGNVQLLFSQFSRSEKQSLHYISLVPYSPDRVDGVWNSSYSDFSAHSMCKYYYLSWRGNDVNIGDDFVDNNMYHETGITSGCENTKAHFRYVGENDSRYLYELTTTCTSYASESLYDRYTSTQKIGIDKTVVGVQTPNDMKLDEVNKKLDELKEGMLFKAPDVGGVVSTNPGDYVGLTSQDVIYGTGTDVPKQCICSDNVINKSCPLHGIGCADCICVGNEYSKECTVHGSLAAESENTGILSNIYEGVKSIARSIADAVTGVGAGVYTAVGEIATFLKDMFKPSDFDLDFDEFEAISLADKFPFCIPFDFYKCISVWSAGASNYKLHVDIDTSFWKINHTVDMSPYSVPIKFFRLFCIVLFSYILITRTRSLMEW